MSYFFMIQKINFEIQIFVNLQGVFIIGKFNIILQTGEAETITSHYLFAQGSYRALYLANWVYRYHYENHLDLIAIVAGVVQETFKNKFSKNQNTFQIQA